VNIEAALAVAEAYKEAEFLILARITAAVRAGLSAPDFEVTTLARLQRLRADSVAALAGANRLAGLIITSSVQQAYAEGSAAALSQIGELIDPIGIASLQQRAAVQLVVGEMVDGITGMQTDVLRQVDDKFRRVVSKTVSSTLARGETRKAAAQRAITQFYGQGLKTFPDRGGRAWKMADYANMAVRTGTRKAQIQGHEAVMEVNGLDLVVVHPGPRACSICDKWARAVLSRSGQSGTITTTNVRTGKPMKVKVGGTLAEARAANFQHPNCRCTLRAYLPGSTDPDVIERPEWNQSGYEAQQKQRALEVAVREAKLKQATALDPKFAKEQAAQVREAQKAIRAHLDENTTLKRQYGREQVQ